MRKRFTALACGIAAFVSSAETPETALLKARSAVKVETIAAVGDTPLEIEYFLPAQVYDGYLFWHQADEIATDVANYAMLLNGKGEVVHRWENDLTGGGHTSYLLESGGLLRMGIRDRNFVKGQPVVAADMLQITDKAGRPIWELNAKTLSKENSRITFHHDLLPMPNGNILVVIYEEISPEDAVGIGWNAGNGKKVWSDGVIEIKPDLKNGSHELVWRWRFADHIIQDVDQAAPNYGVVAEHSERIDAHFPTNYAPMNTVRQHINGIDYNPELDQILLSSLIYNEIWVIDHSTTIEEARGSTGGRRGKGGDLLFRYGNPAAYNAGAEEDRIFLKQHDANWIDRGLPGAGNILVMNNNTEFSPAMLGPGFQGGAAAVAQEQLKGASNVHEIRPNMRQQGSYVVENGQYNAEKIWFWEDPAFFAPFQGGARRLPNGNTLLSNTVGRTVVEVNAEGKMVARYAGPAPTFKSFKFSRERVADLLNQ